MINSNETHILSLPRMSNELFMQLAPYGKSNFNENTGPISVGSQDSLVEQSMPVEYFIRLLAQSIILEAFICRNFPRIGINQKMISIIEATIETFNQDPFSLSRSAASINNLRSNMVKILENLCLGLRQNSHVYQNTLQLDLEDFENEYRRFVATIDERFEHAEEKLTTLKDDAHLTYDILIPCLSIIQREHELGKEWARLFFEYSTLPTARLVPKHDEIQDKKDNSFNSSVQTLTNRGERYIRFTFSPQRFLIMAFIKLALQFFHEYVSHLGAGIYRQNDVNSSFKIPVELDEGWMMHTAYTFFVEKGYKLLGEERRHLQVAIERELADWINKVMRSEEKEYIDRARKGWEVASDFLQLLQYNVTMGTNVKNLYYRLSCDLITRCPMYKNWHVDFINIIGYWLRKRREELNSTLPKCLDSQDAIEFINLDRLWSFIMHHQPQETLSNTITRSEN